MSCTVLGDQAQISYFEIENTRNPLSETKENNNNTNKQINKIIINIQKANQKQRTTQEYHLTTAIRDWCIEPYHTLMCDRPQ
jgi:hypothetical protein